MVQAELAGVSERLKLLQAERETLLTRVQPASLSIQPPAAFASHAAAEHAHGAAEGDGDGDGGVLGGSSADVVGAGGHDGASTSGEAAGGGAAGGGGETSMTSGESEGKSAEAYYREQIATLEAQLAERDEQLSSSRKMSKDKAKAERAKAEADKASIDEADSLRARAVAAEAHVAELQRQLRSKANRLKQLSAAGAAGASSPPKERGGAAADEGRSAALQKELAAKNAELAEMSTQLNLLKDMVRARKADARTKDIQNQQLRRKVGSNPVGSPARPPANVMEQLPSD